MGRGGFYYAGDGGKKIFDVCCLQEVRWGGEDSIMLVMEGSRYKLC